MSLQESTTIPVETKNQLVEIVDKAKAINRPFLSVRLYAMEYAAKIMARIRDGWYYFKHDGIVVLAQIREDDVTEFFCINTSLVDIGFMGKIQEQELYGENREHALSNVVGFVQDEILHKTFDSVSLKHRVEEFDCSKSNIKYAGDFDENYVYTAHIMHDGVKYSCSIMLSQKNGLFCNYVCIPDSIVPEVVTIAGGVKSE